MAAWPYSDVGNAYRPLRTDPSGAYSLDNTRRLYIQQRSPTEITVSFGNCGAAAPEHTKRSAVIGKDGTFLVDFDKCSVMGQFTGSAMSKYWYVDVRTRGRPDYTPICAILAGEWYVDAGLEA